MPVDDRGRSSCSTSTKSCSAPHASWSPFPHVSNALGTVMPVRQMVEIAQPLGAQVLVDGAQAVARTCAVDVQALDCGLLSSSRATRSSRPTGIGVLYGKADAARVHAAVAGRRQHDPRRHVREGDVPAGPPARFEAGTGNIADAVGLGAALDYARSDSACANIAAYEHDLLVYATDALADDSAACGSSAPRATRPACCRSCVDGHAHARTSARHSNHEGIAVRAGHHCAQPILRRFGCEATVRPSLALYNTCDEIDRSSPHFAGSKAASPPSAASRLIGLQVHSAGKVAEHLAVRFKNLTLTPLDPADATPIQ